MRRRSTRHALCYRSVQRTIAEQALLRPGIGCWWPCRAARTRWRCCIALARLAAAAGRRACRRPRSITACGPSRGGEAAAVVALVRAARGPLRGAGGGRRGAPARPRLAAGRRPPGAGGGAGRGRRARWAAPRVALGHTADDQAETMLFRIVRGTGLRGLAGIPYRARAFVRPLLDVRRAQVLRFLRRRRRALPGGSLQPGPALHPQPGAPRVVAVPGPGEPAHRRGAAGPGGGEPGAAVVARGDRAAWAPGPGRAAAARIAALARAERRDQVGVVPGWHGRGGLRPGDAASTPAARPRRARRCRGPPGHPRSRQLSLVRRAAAHWLVELRLTRATAGQAAGAPAVARFEADCLAQAVAAGLAGRRSHAAPWGPGPSQASDLFVDAKVPRAVRAQLPVLVTGDGHHPVRTGAAPSRAAPAWSRCGQLGRGSGDGPRRAPFMPKNRFSVCAR